MIIIIRAGSRSSPLPIGYPPSAPVLGPVIGQARRRLSAPPFCRLDRFFLLPHTTGGCPPLLPPVGGAPTLVSLLPFQQGCSAFGTPSFSIFFWSDGLLLYSRLPSFPESAEIVRPLAFALKPTTSPSIWGGGVFGGWRLGPQGAQAIDLRVLFFVFFFFSPPACFFLCQLFPVRPESPSRRYLRRHVFVFYGCPEHARPSSPGFFSRPRSLLALPSGGPSRVFDIDSRSVSYFAASQHGEFWRLLGHTRRCRIAAPEVSSDDIAEASLLLFFPRLALPCLLFFLKRGLWPPYSPPSSFPLF